MKETEIIQKSIIPYLTNLGYSSNSIYIDYKITADQIVDIVIFDNRNDAPYIIIEIKSKDHLPATDEPARLRFHPSVRQLQRHSANIRANYYLLTDGERYLWFETDDVGRPRLLNDPVRPQNQQLNYRSSPSREEIVRNFRYLLEHLRGEVDWGTQNSQISTILFAFFRDLAFGNDDSKNFLVESPSIDSSRIDDLKDFGLFPNDRMSKREVQEAFRILEQLPLSKASSSDILLAIDEVFLQRINSLLSVSRWLADTLISLASLKNGSIVLDLYSNAGNVLAAASLSSNEKQIFGIARNSRDFTWTKIQQLVLRERSTNIAMTDIFSSDYTIIDTFPRPTHIVTAPVMGGRVAEYMLKSNLFEQGVKQTEDLLLELAIQKVQTGGTIVFLVPEGLMFGSGKRSKIRQLLVDQTTIQAIIGLENGALKPYSAIKTSILVLEKRRANSNHQVFMANVEGIDEIPFPNTILNCTDIPQIARVINEYKEWYEKGVLPDNSSSWIVPLASIDVQNLTVTRYMHRLQNAESDLSKYPLVSLEDVCLEIKRGKAIKLDDKGTIPVIGPASVRAMRMEVASVGYTNSDAIPLKAVTVKKNDVLINNIGTHLGAAAVIPLGLNDHFISQHLMLLRPKQEMILPEYLAAAINSKFVQPQIMQYATGTVMPSLSLSRLLEINIPLPDIITQSQIIDKIRVKLQSLEDAESGLLTAQTQLAHVLENLDSGE